MAGSNYYSSAFLRKGRTKQRPWRGILKHTNEDGTSTQVSMTFDETVRTKTQANAALEKWRSKMEAEHATPDATLTVAEYVTNYIDEQERSRSIEDSTVLDYRNMSKHIVSRFSDVALKDLSPSQVRAWEASMLESGLSPITVGKAHRLLKMVCKSAVDDHVLIWNPCDPVKPPKRPAGEPNALTGEQLARFMTMLDSMGPTKLATAAALALFAGLRRGEVCGLRWSEVDLEHAEVRISQAIGIRKGGSYVKAPKSAKGRRTVAIPQQLVPILRDRLRVSRDAWDAMVKALGITPSDEAFLHTYVIGDADGTPASPALLTREWNAFSRNVPIIGNQGRHASFHDLRHSFVTAAIAGGADVKSVSSLSGHSDASMTLNTYASADGDAKRAAAVRLGEEFARVAERYTRDDQGGAGNDGMTNVIKFPRVACE